MTITVAIDGSALGNPGPAGWAWVVSPQQWDAGGWPRATNNIGELSALLELLRATREAGLADEELLILADSQYVINCVTKWLPGWKRRGWKKADGQPVANRELLEEIDREIRGRHFRFEWVKGHAGHALNELADDRAREAAIAFQAGRPYAGGPGFDGQPTPREAPVAPPTETLNLDGPAPTVTSQQAVANWDAVLSAAQVRPVTITMPDGRDLLLMDAKQGCAALSGGEGTSAPTLF